MKKITKATTTSNIKVRYDPQADAAYIYLTKIGPGEVWETRPRTVLCDFDKDGRLLGIELFDASKRLPKTVLCHANSRPAVYDTDDKTTRKTRKKRKPSKGSRSA